jgi:hypothetical protein
LVIWYRQIAEAVAETRSDYRSGMDRKEYEEINEQYKVSNNNNCVICKRTYALEELEFEQVL